MRLDTATPASTSVVRAAPARRATRYTMSVETSAPTSAMSCRATPLNGKSSVPANAKKPAPALIPITWGEARSLSRAACSSAPDTASETPQAQAANTRGRRTPHTMRCAEDEVAAPVRACHASAVESAPVLARRDAAIASARQSPPATSANTARRLASAATSSLSPLSP